MSLEKSPQSRYRVEEKGGRLVVTDTWSGDAPITARHMNADNHVFDPEPIESAEDKLADFITRSAAPPPPSQSARPSLQPKPATPWAQQQSSPPNASARPARTSFTKPATIRTLPWFDKKGPRTIAMSSTRKSQAIFGALALFFGIMVLNAIIDGNFFSLLVICAVLYSAARKPLVNFTTNWLDAAERETDT